MPLTVLFSRRRQFRRFLQRLPVLGQLRLQRLVNRLKLPEYTLFALAAVVTGGLAGLTAVGFHNAIEFFRELFFSRSREVIGFLGSLQIILLPAIGMLLQAGMIMLWPSLAARKGVLEVIKAVTAAGYYIPLRVTLFHLIAPAICMGSGGTVGPEGPAAQIGAGVASRFGRALRLSDVRRRIFTAAGAGAAIAAVFNTPLGGVFFALEIVLLNDFQTGTFSALLLASVAASAVSRTLLGNQPAFAITEIAIGPVWHLALYTLLGLCAGVLAVLFLRYSDWLHSRLRPHLKGWRQPAIMTAAGLLVGIAGFFFLDLLGIGYEGINRVLRGETVWQVALALLVLKFFLVPLMLESGGFGGVFAPSLFLGAMLGLLFATGCNLLAPALGFRVEVDAYVLVGMGAMLAAINSIPLAAILILFEMTNDYSFILPLIVGVVASSTIVHLAWKDNLYARKLRKAGYRLQSPRAANLLQGLTVRDLMRREKVEVLEEDAPLPQVIRFCAGSPRANFYLKSKRGELTGTITMNELRQVITEYESLKQSRLIARDIALPGVVTVAENDELDYVLRLFGSHSLEEFPVVAPHNPREIRGSLERRDVINAFNKASLQQNLTAGLAGSLRTLETIKHVSVAKGFSLVEKIAPAAFVGKSLEELKVRSRFGVEVILIKPGRDPLQPEKNGAALMPAAGYRIRAGDALVLFGEDENLAALEQM